jgi:hypothetical protein
MQSSSNLPQAPRRIHGVKLGNKNGLEIEVSGFE